MPITSSAKKALRSGEKKRINNLRTKAAIDTPLKNFRKLISSNNLKEAKSLVPAIYKALDKAAKRNYIKANTSARYKSRVMSSLKKLEGIK
jgi:ribosomal protein S20